MTPIETRTVSIPLVAGGLLLLAAASCSSSDNAGPTRMQGALTVPSLGAGAARFVEDDGINDVAHQAQDAGELKAGEVVILRGVVGSAGDPLDVFKVHVTSPFTVAVSGGADVDLAVFETATGHAVLDDAGGEFSVRGAGVAFDVALQSSSEQGYEITVRAGAPGRAVARTLPTSPLATPVLTPISPFYVGAQHEMLAGEVVVMRDVDGPAPARLALQQVGLVRAGAATPGPLQVYRLAAPAAVSVNQGAALAQSLEMQTCLAAQRAAALPGVRTASPNYVYRAYQNSTPNDMLYNLQWHYGHINLPQAWAITNGSANVIVAVVDTGMVLAHPDFQGRLTNTGHDLISDATRALDGDGIDPNPDDPGDNFGTSLPSSFHGTHCGGTVGATSNNSVGVAGVDWNCQLMPIRVLGKGGSGSLGDIAQGILYAAGQPNASGTTPAQRCDIMSLSLGGPGSAGVLEQACADANAAGVALIVASGNDNSATLNYPASYATTLSVGSIRFDRQRAPYSNFASTLDLVAPGGDTSVDQNGDNNPDGVLSCLAAYQGTQLQVGYGYLQGTSMACPHVSGVAALMKAVNPGLTPTQIRDGLTATAIDLGPPGRDTDFANGLVDAFAAVQQAGGMAGPNPIFRASPSTLPIGNTATSSSITLSNVGNQGTQITLDMTSAQIAYLSGAGWITSTTLGGTASMGISHSKLDLAVNRGGLADGTYSANITITPTSAGTMPQTVMVIMDVGTPNQSTDEIFVLAVDFDLNNRGQGQTNAAAGFRFTVDPDSAGSFLLVAGTDRDNDGFIGDEGELFGIWPSSDSPQTIAIGAGQTLSNLDFAVQAQALMSVQDRRIKLRR